MGYVKGYDVVNITMKKSQKEKLFEELAKRDSEIKKEVVEVLNQDGYVIGLKKKNVLKSVYLFCLEKENKVLIFNKSVQTEDVEKESIADFEKAILDELSEKVLLDGLEKVDWNDKIIEPRKISNYSVSAFLICLSLGLLVGVIYDELALGLLFGMSIGLSLGVIVKNKK